MQESMFLKVPAGLVHLAFFSLDVTVYAVFHM